LIRRWVIDRGRQRYSTWQCGARARRVNREWLKPHLVLAGIPGVIVADYDAIRIAAGRERTTGVVESQSRKHTAGSANGNPAAVDELPGSIDNRSAMQATDNRNLDPFSVVDTEAEEVGVQRIVDRTVHRDSAGERDVLACAVGCHRFEPDCIRAGVTGLVGLHLEAIWPT
jgi:hypothetical protein